VGRQSGARRDRRPARAGRAFAGRSGALHVLVSAAASAPQALNETVPQGAGAASPKASGRRSCIRPASASGGAEANYAAAGVQATRALHRRHGRRLRQADLVICRAGALTVAELAAAGVASVLVPFPHAVDDHQTGNAASWPMPARLLLPQAN
jgi:UDP-N-acetylglucosamine--N-acetylmuramyl-(pentapeptide) pyrophosphoryl-undecaprenol N-acetylglucosamine transferase